MAATPAQRCAAAQQRQGRGCAGTGRRRGGRSPASPPPTAADAAAAKHRRRRDEDLPWHDEQRTTTSTAAAHPTTAAAPRDDGCVRPGPPTALAGDATPHTSYAGAPHAPPEETSELTAAVTRAVQATARRLTGPDEWAHWRWDREQGREEREREGSSPPPEVHVKPSRSR